MHEEKQRKLAVRVAERLLGKLEFKMEKIHGAAGPQIKIEAPTEVEDLNRGLTDLIVTPEGRVRLASRHLPQNWVDITAFLIVREAMEEE